MSTLKTKQMLQELEDLTSAIDNIKLKANGLRKKLLHFYEGATPKGEKKSIKAAPVIDKYEVIDSFRKSLKRKMVKN